MRLIAIIFTALALGASTVGLAQKSSWEELTADDSGSSTAAQLKVEKEVRDFRRTLADALRKCDQNQLRRYFPADYMATEGSGWILNRDDMSRICKKQNAETGIEVAEPATMRVRVLSDSAAAVTGTSYLNRGGERVAVRWLAFYARGSESGYTGWQQVFAQVHRVALVPPGPPVAPSRQLGTPAH